MSEIKDIMAPKLSEEKQKALDEAKKRVRAGYGENKRITDGNYDKALAVKCINGTFVGRKTNDVIAYKGIPFTAKPPVGELRWKAPVEYTTDDGIYEAYYNGKSPRQGEDISEGGSLYYQSEDCLYLNVWKADDTGTADEEAAHPGALKPVMVWIHGGGYAMGGRAILCMIAIIWFRRTRRSSSLPLNTGSVFLDMSICPTCRTVPTIRMRRIWVPWIR